MPNLFKFFFYESKLPCTFPMRNMIHSWSGKTLQDDWKKWTCRGSMHSGDAPGHLRESWGVKRRALRCPRVSWGEPGEPLREGPCRAYSVTRPTSEFWPWSLYLDPAGVQCMKLCDLFTTLGYIEICPCRESSSTKPSFSGRPSFSQLTVWSEVWKWASQHGSPGKNATV